MAPQLGPKQIAVLQLLAEEGAQDGRTARELARAWPGLTEESVRSALGRLVSRGLVECRGYAYKLTQLGIEAEESLLIGEEAVG